MSLSAFVPSVKAVFDATFKATGLGGLALFAKAAQKLGVFRTITSHLPDGPQQTLAVQMAAGLSVGGSGQSAADLISQDTEVPRILGIRDTVGPKRVHATLSAMAGRSTRSKEEKQAVGLEIETRRNEEKEKARRRKNRAKKKRRKKWTAEQEPEGESTPLNPASRPVVPGEQWTKEREAMFREMEFEVLSNIVKFTNSADLKFGGYYPTFIDGSLLETDAKTSELAAKDRNGKESVLFMGFWLGPYLVAHELYPGNVEEGSVAAELLLRGFDILDRLGIPRDKILLMADSAYGQGHLISLLKKSKIEYIIGMNRHRKYLTKKAMEFVNTHWKSSDQPSRNNRTEQFLQFKHQALEWDSSVVITAVKFIAQGELVPQFSFITSSLKNKDIANFPESYKKELIQPTIWTCYAHKQAYENYQKDLLSDLGMHHPSSSRTCINQVLYSIASISLNVGVFISRTIAPKPFHNARLWRIARSLYSIPAIVTRSGRYLHLRLSTAVIPAIQLAWMASMEKLATI